MTGYPCCCGPVAPPQPPCNFCAGDRPESYEVVVSGVVDDACPGGCSAWNGTWVVTRRSDLSGCCTWEYMLSAGERSAIRQGEILGTCSVPESAHIRLFLCSGEWRVEFNLRIAIINEFYIFRITPVPTAPDNACEMDQVVFPYYLRGGGDSVFACDFSSATVEVTAV